MSSADIFTCCIVCWGGGTGCLLLLIRGHATWYQTHYIWSMNAALRLSAKSTFLWLMLCHFVSGRNVGIKISHGVIWRFFAPQCRHVPPSVAKFGTSEKANNPLRRANFQVDRSIYGDFWPKKLQKYGILQTYSPCRGESLNQCLWNLYGVYENVSNLMSFGA